MKFLTFIACLAAACLSTTPAIGATSPWTYSPRTIVCSFSEIHVSFGTLEGGTFAVTNGGDTLFSASPARGIVRRMDSHCKLIRTRTLPKPVMPSASYPMGLGEEFDCSSRGPVLIHAHFLRTAGRLSGLYISIRERRTGRFIAAARFSERSARSSVPACVAR
jgi:hypothetical protein